MSSICLFLLGIFLLIIVLRMGRSDKTLITRLSIVFCSIMSFFASIITCIAENLEV